MSLQILWFFLRREKNYLNIKLYTISYEFQKLYIVSIIIYAGLWEKNARKILLICISRVRNTINNYPRPQARARAILAPFELWIQLRLRRTRIPGRTCFPRGRLEGAVIVYSRRYNLYGHLCGRIRSVDSILGYILLSLFPSLPLYFPLSLSLFLSFTLSFLDGAIRGFRLTWRPKHRGRRNIPLSCLNFATWSEDRLSTAPQPLCARDLSPAFLVSLPLRSLFLSAVFTAR